MQWLIPTFARTNNALWQVSDCFKGKMWGHFGEGCPIKHGAPTVFATGTRWVSGKFWQIKLQETVSGSNEHCCVSLCMGSSHFQKVPVLRAQWQHKAGTVFCYKPEATVLTLAKLDYGTSRMVYTRVCWLVTVWERKSLSSAISSSVSTGTQCWIWGMSLALPKHRSVSCLW